MKTDNSGNGSTKQKTTKTHRYRIDPKKSGFQNKRNAENKTRTGTKNNKNVKHVQSAPERKQKYIPGNNLKIIPLGGLGEIGKNMTAFEYGNDIVIVDVGMSFPDENMPGVDCVIPDFTYIRRNQSKLRGIVLTHDHEDHIGSLPYFLREFQCPVYGGTMTIELVRHKLQDKNVPLDGIISLIMSPKADLFGIHIQTR